MINIADLSSSRNVRRNEFRERGQKKQEGEGDRVLRHRRINEGTRNRRGAAQRREHARVTSVSPHENPIRLLRVDCPMSSYGKKIRDESPRTHPTDYSALTCCPRTGVTTLRARACKRRASSGVLKVARQEAALSEQPGQVTSTRMRDAAP